jgi:Zn finger protein HypA/HybF involved in hydrogenase expression
MSACRHTTLELLPERRSTVRCKHCHLTLSADEIGDGFCPECFDGTRVKRYDFESLSSGSASVVRYRCEECGAIIAVGEK